MLRNFDLANFKNQKKIGLVKACTSDYLNYKHGALSSLEI